MGRSERRNAQRENRPPKTLGEIDYLLLVDDEARQGALRFAEQPGGPFVAHAAEPRIPLFIDLPRLLAAGQNAAVETETDDELRLLLVPGSSLGGARPKALVRDPDGRLAVAKFPHPNDEYDIEKWEAVALSLAGRSGIVVPEWRVESVSNQTVLLSRRFDRDGVRRTPFLSAMSMLGARDGEGHSYLEIVDALRRYGSQPIEDARELWRRIVFNVLISNTDDHLRNHGFLYVGGAGWRLSPAYDLNPVPLDLKARFLSTAIAPDQNEASLELALEYAPYFEIDKREAEKIAKEIAGVVSGWRAVAANQGLSAVARDRMQTAFEHRELEKARRLD